MKGLNKATLIGNLGKDPEYQILENNQPLAKLTLATSDSYKDKDGKIQTTTEWHNIVLWRGLAETAHKHLHKGSCIYIEGKIKTRSYEDKDGNKKYVTEIMADELIMLDKKAHSNTEEKTRKDSDGLPNQWYKRKTTVPGNKNDDLPF